MRISLVAALAFVTLGTACGGSNPGSGSRTFYVKAQLESDGTPDGTWAAVQVRQGNPDGPLVDGATVTLRGDSTGEIVLPVQNVPFGSWVPPWYGKNNLTWDNSGWALSVRKLDDYLDAYLQVPGPTLITQPIYNTTFHLSDGVPLVVKWEDSKGHRAETVTVELNHSQVSRQLPPGDPLELAIEQTSLVAGDERVTVTRQNAVNLAGGTPSSVFTASTSHRVPFIIQ